MIINVENFEVSVLEKINNTVERYKNNALDYRAFDGILNSIKDTISYFQDLMLDNYVLNKPEYVEFNNYLFDIKRYIIDITFWSVDYIINSDTPVPVYKKQEQQEQQEQEEQEQQEQEEQEQQEQQEQEQEQEQYYICPNCKYYSLYISDIDYFDECEYIRYSCNICDFEDLSIVNLF